MPLESPWCTQQPGCVKLLWLVAHTNVCMAVAATDCVLHACRVKGGQELVAAIQAAKQARLKVRPRCSAASTTCGDLGVPIPKAGSMAVLKGVFGGGVFRLVQRIQHSITVHASLWAQAARAAHYLGTAPAVGVCLCWVLPRVNPSCLCPGVGELEP